MLELLLTPGPTPIPESVLRILGEAVPHHRTKRFEEAFAKARAGLKNLFALFYEIDILI
jgi:aspartate aminotransferase-like enzyme